MPIADAPIVHGPADGEHVRLAGNLGVRRMAPGLVEHDLPGRRLGAPTHHHDHEDEWSYVLSGHLTAQIGDEIAEAGPGEMVRKPRGIPHAMWNARDEPVRFLEVMHPAGFEEYFFEVAGALEAGDLERIGEISARYGLHMDLDAAPRLIAEHGLEG